MSNFINTGLTQNIVLISSKIIKIVSKKITFIFHLVYFPLLNNTTANTKPT
ncbi:Uncharacterised protein [Streptococcus pneumoniae]|nr:Uncharacterised protein [Streptococcus pneumoniae]